MALGAHADTVTRWLEESPELKEAFEQGRETERATLHNVVYETAMARNGKESLLAAFFLLNSRHGYKDERPTEANRVSINFQLPGAMPLDQFTVIENEPKPRIK